MAPALHEAVPSWLSTNNAQAQQGGRGPILCVGLNCSEGSRTSVYRHAAEFHEFGRIGLCAGAMSFVIPLLVNAAALWVATRIVPGVTYTGEFLLLLAVALVFGISTRSSGPW